MRHDVGETFEVHSLELLHSAIAHDDQDAWTAFQQSLDETVLTWLYHHPGREAAGRWQSEQHFVALAFERLWQAAVQGQVIFETLSKVLVYLRASLNGVILETLRVSSRPGAVSAWMSGEQYLDDNPESSEIWDWLQARLSSEREQRLAYLLYHCGLEPREIVQCCPQEWSDFQEVAHLRRVILARLMSNLNCERQTFISQDRLRSQ